MLEKCPQIPATTIIYVYCLFLFHLRLICRNHFVRLLEIGCRAIAFGAEAHVMASRCVVNNFEAFSSDNVDRRLGWSRGEKKHKKIVYDFDMQISGQFSCCSEKYFSDECTPACTHSRVDSLRSMGLAVNRSSKNFVFWENMLSRNKVLKNSGAWLSLEKQFTRLFGQRNDEKTNFREIESKYSALQSVYRQIMVKKNIDTMEVRG